MMCKEYCKHFINRAIGYNPGYIEGKVVIYGRCNKYSISTNTNNECLDTLDYNEK